LRCEENEKNISHIDRKSKIETGKIGDNFHIELILMKKET